MRDGTAEFTEQFSVMLPPVLASWLRAEAASRDRPVSYVLRTLVADAQHEQEHQAMIDAAVRAAR
jgi:hypothetical protein